jgi:hypothetical protein
MISKIKKFIKKQKTKALRKKDTTYDECIEKCKKKEKYSEKNVVKKCTARAEKTAKDWEIKHNIHSYNCFQKVRDRSTKCAQRCNFKYKKYGFK